MNYNLRYTKKAIKDLKKLDKFTNLMIKSWIDSNLKNCSDPRSTGKALKGNKSGSWRYRIGSYRIICEIKDEELIILALQIGHRSDIYNK